MKIPLKTILICLSLIGTGSLLSATGSALAAEAAAQDALRPAVGKLLQAAQELSKSKQYQEALAKIDETDGVKDKTPYESFMIARIRGATAFSAGKIDLAAQSFTTAMSYDRLTASDIQGIAKVLADQFYQKPDYQNAALWASRYLEKGGSDPQIKVLLAQSHYLLNDYSKAATLLQELSLADEAAGRLTSEIQLQIRLNCEIKLKRNEGLVATLEKLVVHYPKKDYWNNLIRRIQRIPAFSERLVLDAYRLQHYAGSLDSAELMEMAGLAIQAAYPVEAKKLLDQGYSDQLLGSGEDAAKHKKMLDQASKEAAEDLKVLAQDEKRAEAAKTGVSAVGTGFNFVLHGQFDKGIALIEKGIAKGGLKHPEEAKLKLAMAYLYAGQKDKAVQVFKSITGTDGTEELARLWVIRINQG